MRGEGWGRASERKVGRWGHDSKGECRACNESSRVVKQHQMQSYKPCRSHLLREIGSAAVKGTVHIHMAINTTWAVKMPTL